MNLLPDIIQDGGNIPKGQLTRIRRNCENDKNFEEQANEIINRFTKKGCNKSILELAKKKIL